MGDGYKAINIMLRNCKDQQPVREKFHAQLNMREKPKFSKGDDLEALRQQALSDFGRQKEENPKRKSKKTTQWNKMTK